MTEEDDTTERHERKALETWAREVLAATERLRGMVPIPLDGPVYEAQGGILTVERIARLLAGGEATSAHVQAIVEPPSSRKLLTASTIVAAHGTRYLAAKSVKERKLVAVRMIGELADLHPDYRALLELITEDKTGFRRLDVEDWLSKFSPKHPPGRGRLTADRIAAELDSLAGNPLGGAPLAKKAGKAPRDPKKLAQFERERTLRMKREGAASNRVRSARSRARKG